jgi:hypothetical protein
MSTEEGNVNLVCIGWAASHQSPIVERLHEGIKTVALKHPYRRLVFSNATVLYDIESHRKKRVTATRMTIARATRAPENSGS